LELLLSLLSLVLDYDPGGLRIPFSGANKEQEYVAVAVQVLALLLQSSADMSIAAESAILANRPQETIGRVLESVLSSRTNAFRCA
jgi:hypothetical protein